MPFFSKKIGLIAFAAMPFMLSAQTLLEKADKQYELHAFRIAAQNYEKVLATDADAFVAAANLASCYRHLNEHAKAAKWYAVALNYDALPTDTRLYYAESLLALGKYAEATAQLNIYKKTDSEAANALLASVKFAQQETPSVYVVSNETKINTNTADFGASLYKTDIIWSSSRNDIKRKINQATADASGSFPNQLFTLGIEGIATTPSKLRFLKQDISNTFNESNVSISGNTVAFMRNNFVDGIRPLSSAGLEMAIFIATIDTEGNWSDAKPFIYNNGMTGFPFLTDDGKTLYFASNRTGGYGGLDLYVCQKRGNMWAEPRNMGATINTSADEISPFSQGKYFYFASNGHTGFGGFDIFRTEGPLQKVENLGSGINSSFDDYGFVLYNNTKTAFFTSNRLGGKGYEDIYRGEIKAAESANIVVVDAATKKPLTNVKAVMKQGNPENLTAMKEGNFILDLSDLKMTIIEFSKEEFKAKSVTVEPNFKKGSKVVEVALERLSAATYNENTEGGYVGTVTDGRNGGALSGVRIKAINQADNTRAESVSDENGKFNLKLKKDATYLVVYSKEGFANFQRNVKADGSIKKITETILEPSSLSGTPTLVQPVPNTPATNTANNGTTTPTNPTSTNTGTSVKVPAFAIQLSVSASTKEPDMTRFVKDLGTLGNVYFVTESGKQKIRLGVYKTRNQAEEALKNVRNNTNYGSAFIVEETNAKPVKEKIFTPTRPKGVGATTSNNDEQNLAVVDIPEEKPSSYNVQIVKPQVPPVPPKATEQPAKVPEPIDKTYKVRLGTYKDEKNFDDSKVSKMWKIESVKEGKMTVFFMDGFRTLQDAKEMKAKVQKVGFKDAKVVQKQDGKFKVID